MTNTPVWNSVLVDSSDISLEEQKIGSIDGSTRKHPYRMSDEQDKKEAAISSQVNYFNLRSILSDSFKGKLCFGDTQTGLANILRQSPVFNHLNYLQHEYLLNEKNSSLDFGELPSGFSKPVSRGFNVPRTSLSRFIVEYSECQPCFVCEQNYEANRLSEYGISNEEFTKSINNASDVLRPFRGVVTKSDVCFLLYCLIGLLVVLITGILLGIFISYIITIVLLSVYAITLIAIFLYNRKKNQRLLYISHIALALFIRCENNRLYLKHKILARPGYLGKWIEFNMLPTQQSTEIL